MRPGFNERGQAAVMRTELLRQKDEEAHRTTCAARTEQTRKRTRKLYQASATASRNLPVPMALARAAERSAARHATVVYRAEARTGAAEVAMIGVTDGLDVRSDGGRARAPPVDEAGVDGEPQHSEQQPVQHAEWKSPLALRSGFGAQRARLSVE